MKRREKTSLSPDPASGEKHGMRSPQLGPKLSRAVLWGSLLGALALSSGCFTGRDTTNEPLDAEKIASLEPGETRASDVVELLGAPTEVVQLARRSAYRYDYTNRKRYGLFLIVANFLNEDTRSDRLWVFFDENQVLSHFGATLQGDASVYAMPWDPIHGEE